VGFATPALGSLHVAGLAWSCCLGVGPLVLGVGVCHTAVGLPTPCGRTRFFVAIDCGRSWPFAIVRCGRSWSFTVTVRYRSFTVVPCAVIVHCRGPWLFAAPFIAVVARGGNNGRSCQPALKSMRTLTRFPKNRVFFQI